MFRNLIIPIAFTVTIHVFLLVLVTWGWQQDNSKIPIIKPKVIQASLVQMKQQAKPQEAKKPKVDDAKKKKELEKKQKELAAKKQQEIERKLKAAEQKKQKEKELALKRIKEKEKAEDDKKKAEAEKKRKELEKKEQQRLEREKQAAEEKRRAERELAKQLAEEEAQEQAQLLQEAETQMAMSYIDVISQSVQYNWSRPPSARNGMSVELTVQLIPSGEVIAVTVKQSSGNNAFDRSAENAVKKVGRFPELAELYRKSPRVFEKYFRRFNFKFTPDDLRR